MRSILYVVLLLLVIFSSCLADNVDESVTVIQPSEYEYGLSNSWLDDVTYIPLSSRNSAEYLFGIEKILMNENYIFVLQDNGTERSILKFDKDGNCVKAINGSDNIEKKFYAVTDFDFYDSEIVVTDLFTQGISFFDQDLRFLRSVAMAENVGAAQNIHFLNSNTIVCRPDLESGPPSSVLRSELEETMSPDMIGDFIGVKGTPADRMRISVFETFHNSSEVDKVLYTDFFDNSIYEVGLDHVVKKYQLLLDDDLWVTEQEVTRMTKMDMDEQFEFLDRIGKSDLIKNVYESEKYLMFSFMIIRKRYFVFFNRETKEQRSAVLDFGDVNPNRKDGSPPLKYFLGFTNGGDLMFYHKAEEFKLYAESMRNKSSEALTYSKEQKNFLQAADKVDEYCNIVLAVMKIKDF